MRPRHILLGIAVIAAVAVAAAERLNLDMKPEVAGASTPPAAPPAMPVPVTSVVTATVPITLDYAARTESIRAISLQAKVSAYIKDQPAPDGADVKANDLLYRLDPRDFQVALDQANAQVERDAASLDYQRSNFQRGDSLAKSGWLAKDNFDERSSTLRQAEAALTLARASVRGAQLSLDYTQIRAPFAGRLGRNQAPVGTLIGVGGTVLNTLVQLDPIYVTFNPSETDLVALSTARGAGIVQATISVPGQAEGAGAPGRAHLHRQCGRPCNGHRDGTRHHRQRGFRLAARPICQGAAAPSRPGRCLAGPAGRRRIEPARQIRLRGRCQQRRRTAHGAARHRVRRQGLDPLGHLRGRQDHHRKPTEDRSRHAGASPAEKPASPS